MRSLESRDTLLTVLFVARRFVSISKCLERQSDHESGDICKVVLTYCMLYALSGFTNALINLTLQTPKMQTSMREHYLSSA